MAIFSDYGAIIMQIYYMKRHWKHCNYIVGINIAIYDKSKRLLYRKINPKGTMYLDIANFFKFYQTVSSNKLKASFSNLHF